MTKEYAQLLDESLHGKVASTEALMEALYQQMRSMAAHQLKGERSDHTLQPTALVNEAYLRLLGETEIDWQNTSHFRAIAANIMRRILVDHARAKNTGKRGGKLQRVCLSLAPLRGSDDVVEISVINELLEQLAELNPRHGRVVELRVFGGLTLPEIAKTLGFSLATIKKDWRFARVWLLNHLSDAEEHDQGNDE